MEPYKAWQCSVCDCIYDEAKGWSDEGVEPGTYWEDVPDDWLCPECFTDKADFEMVVMGSSVERNEVDRPAPVSPVSNDANDEPYQVWECLVCGWIYDEVKGWPEDGILPGTRWEDIPDDWVCPECFVGKDDFEMVAVSRTAVEEKAKVESPKYTIDYTRKPIVIIGTGLAGYNLAKEFRKLDQTTPLVMLTNDDGRFYSKPLISVGYHKNKSADQIATASAEDMAGLLAADIRIFTEVIAVDPDSQLIETTTSKLHYEKLVFATGARCIEAPLEGDGLEKVHSINDLLDYSKFRTAMVNKRKVLIIGAGLIGSEYCNDLILSGYEIDVVDPLDSVLGTLLPKTAADSVKNALESKGAKFHFGTVVKRIDKKGVGVQATLGNGETIDADIVLSAIGVRPNLKLAEQCGLETNRGIVTDLALQTSAKNVYALGDCAEVDNHVLFYIAPLMACARALAKSLVGEPCNVYYGAMPVTVKTTLFPIIVSPPPKNVVGQWVIEASSPSGVRALFRDSNDALLGFALTGDHISNQDELAKQVAPIMAAS
ncbi:MAG: FAD-dependent oxidoreductase [Halioglobus sp.]